MGKKQRVHGPTRPIYEYLHYNKYEWDQEREGQKTVESEDREATSSSRSWTANRSEDDARDRNPREYEIVMRADVSLEQTIHLAQDLANQHGRDLVIELPDRDDGADAGGGTDGELEGENNQSSSETTLTPRR